MPDIDYDSLRVTVLYQDRVHYYYNYFCIVVRLPRGVVKVNMMWEMSVIDKESVIFLQSNVHSIIYT